MLPVIKGREPTETICPQCKEQTTTKIENIFSGKVIQDRYLYLNEEGAQSYKYTKRLNSND